MSRETDALEVAKLRAEHVMMTQWLDTLLPVLQEITGDYAAMVFEGRRVQPDEQVLAAMNAQAYLYKKKGATYLQPEGADGTEPEDTRPLNCRFRQKDEGKTYPRSGCTACGANAVRLKDTCPRETA